MPQHKGSYAPLFLPAERRWAGGAELNGVGEEVGYNAIYRCTYPGCNVQVKCGGSFSRFPPTRELHDDPTSPGAVRRWGAKPIGETGNEFRKNSR